MAVISDYAISDAAHREREKLLLELLGDHPEGVDTYRMIKTLQAVPASGLPPGSMTEALILFRCNFLLYNALYRLRDRLREQRQGFVDIGVLKTVLYPYRPAQAGLTEYDTVRSLFLDFSYLEKVGEDDVQTLLQQFWTRFYAAADKQWALQILGLCEPVDYGTIKQQYRRLAMRYHPDRGGDQETLVALNTAIEILDSYYLRV